MKDLISREALLENAQRMTEYDEAGWGVPVRVVKVEHIETAPAVDAVEVKRGRWISIDECSNEGVCCSECHKKVYKADYAWCVNKNKVRSNYCPNCGARMDGE